MAIREAENMTRAQRGILEELSAGLSATYCALESLRKERSKINEMDDLHEKAKAYASIVRPLMDDVRDSSRPVGEVDRRQPLAFPKAARTALYTLIQQ